MAPLGYVFGIFGIVATLDASGTRTGFDPGSYTVAPQNVFDGDVRYSATSVTQTVNVGLTPRSYTINYIARTGRLTIAATGLPDGASAAARVTGPAGFDTTLALGDTLKSLPTGSYTVAGELLECPDCGTELEIESVDPVKVTEAPTEEEDWGE